jgi:hypothetical protein
MHRLHKTCERAGKYIHTPMCIHTDKHTYPHTYTDSSKHASGLGSIYIHLCAYILINIHIHIHIQTPQNMRAAWEMVPNGKEEDFENRPNSGYGYAQQDAHRGAQQVNHYHQQVCMCVSVTNESLSSSGTHVCICTCISVD